MVGPFMTGTGTGLVALIATSSWLGGTPPERLPTVPATTDGAVFEPWAMDDVGMFSEDVAVEPNCSWWNGTFLYSSDLCSHFSLSRMASNSAGRAVERAVLCAAHYETECVISPEVGVSIPAAFVYDPAGTGMRMLIAPRIIEQPPTDTDMADDADPTRDIRWIKVQDPEDKTNGHTVQFNHTIKVEYLPGGSRTPVNEILQGADAYCVQLLRAAFHEDCWKALD